MVDDPGSIEEPLEGKTVLLVEDEERLRTIVEMMLEELGARVELAGDGAEAVQIFARDPRSIDAVLLDLRMRGVSGFDVFRRLREIDASVEVVATSGARPDEAFIAEIESAGGVFLEKPFNIEDLSAVFERIFG
ncbi:MAG: response regulator [Polyangia bacterium]